ncbi:uncharacterized protein LOC143285631 [Babylonia areolata]|uniref:uncharacterized protein LOC143285631 n=1 Tax=Babylonia areolata TaxID=304850 RepID=UPI003FCFCA56
MDCCFIPRPTCPWVCQVVLVAILVTGGNAFSRYSRPQSAAPSALRVRPPPMTADPISPDCYNFTIGNWKLQEFYSPNYPGEYLNDTDCVLYLEAPSGFRIQLDFRDEFTLEKSDGCKYDFLEVRDGPFAYSPVIGRFCDAIFPPLIQSSNRFLWLRFKTDNLLQYGGFRAVYSYHKDHTQNDGTSLSKVASTVCRIPLKLEPSHPDGFLTSEEVPFGDVTDPEYPRDRPVDCTWEIFTDQGHAINLHTIKMSRAKNARCEGSYVSLYQGTTLHSDRRARMCGNDAPEVMSLTSSHNRVFVRLFGGSLAAKPILEMVYSLVKTGEACSQGSSLSCGAEFCVSPSLRCNGIPNCPDGRDERGCPGRGGGGGGGGGGSEGGGGGDTGKSDTSINGDDSERGDPKKVNEDEDDDLKIPLHMLILGAVGGILLTCLLLGVCIMCRSRRRRRREARQGGGAHDGAGGGGGGGRGSKTQGKHPPHSPSDPSSTPHGGGQPPSSSSSSHHHHHSRHGGEGGRQGQGQGHHSAPQGRYLTFAHVTPLPKDSPNRHSFTPTPTPTANTNPTTTILPEMEMTTTHHGGGDIMTDSGQFRRFLPLDVGSDHIGGGGGLEDPHHPYPNPHQGCVYTPQGVIIGMTQLPTTTTTAPTVHHQEGGVGYGVKYLNNQWQKGVMEEPSMLYHPPYTSSLPRPSPFLELSTTTTSTTTPVHHQYPYHPHPHPHHQQQGEPGKYAKTLQGLKVREEEDGFKETPAC